MLLLKSLAALSFSCFLPGLFLVKLLDLGRSLEERLVMAAVLGLPVAALLYLASLASGSPALYWLLGVPIAVGAVLLPWKSRAAFVWPRTTVFSLTALVAIVIGAYLLTTGSLYRLDREGNLLLDRALQRDTLFHLGVIRSLESSYPPRLLSASGEPIGYHAGYHLSIALWSRFFGIDPTDGLVRLGASWHLALLILGAYVLARRLCEREGARLLSALLVLASGLGFAFFFRPSVDWWSLSFMDWALVSIFLANPLLPALPLLFVGLALQNDYWETGSAGALGAGALTLAFVFFIKMFLGAQVVAALGLAALGTWRDRRAWTAFATLVLASVPFVLHTFFAAAGSNTRVGFRPLELVRYSMEKLDWRRAVDALADVGRMESPGNGWILVVAATLLWVVGFLGLRILALPSLRRDLSSESYLPSALAWFAVIGFPLSLLFRIAPSEAEGLSRLEALNDAGWFVTASGIILWFATARTLSGFRPAVSALLVSALALPATVQHFVYASSLEPDRIGRSRVEAAHEAERLSPPSSIWLPSPDRARPSVLPYVSGRAVVEDPYVGYEYMFVGREEIDSRRHALAQFWSSSDPAYLAWFVDRFDVDFLWREDRELPGPAGAWLSPVYANGEVELLRIEKDEALAKALSGELETPGKIPMGGQGQAYFGDGWQRAPRESRRWIAPSEKATLYLPIERGRSVSIVLTIDAPHEKGDLLVDGRSTAVTSDAERLSVTLPPRRARGLHAISLEWRAGAPVTVSGIEVAVIR